MRVDDHQMMRKWQVDLYRYGLRMTYDIVVPSPGINLFRHLQEIDRIQRRLDRGLSFDLPVAALTRKHWPRLAAAYGASVPPRSFPPGTRRIST